MDTLTVLQVFGGGFYLLSKVFLSLAGESLLLRRIGWSVYIAGVPFWMMLLWIKSDYIVLGLEFGGGLILVYALIKTFQKEVKGTTKLDIAANGLCVILFFVALYYTLGTKGFGFHPFLEVVIAFSFAISIMMLAKKDDRGWYVMLLLHVATGTLMYRQDVWLLAIQQAISGCFALWAIYKYWKSAKLL